MGAQLDDPNREAVGVAPIWSTGDAPPEADAEAAEKAPKHKGHKASEPEPERDTDTGAT